MDPLLRFFQPTKRCPTGKRQHEKERRNQHPSWDTGHSNIYSGVQKKRWRTYWKYVKLHSITGQWGTLPAENRGLKSAQGPDPLKASGALPFLTLICCIIKQEFTAKDKWGFFSFTDVSHQAARKALHLHKMIHAAEKPLPELVMSTPSFYESHLSVRFRPVPWSLGVQHFLWK